MSGEGFEPRRGRGYSWRDAWPGNDLATKHGADSERKLRPIVDDLLAGLREAAPWTDAPVFRPTAERWAWHEAQALLYRAWFDVHGIGESDDEAPHGLERWDRAEGRAAKAAAELGLTPLALTRLLSGLSSIDAPAATAGLEALRKAGAELAEAASRPAIGAGE